MQHHGEPVNSPHPHLESAKRFKDMATEKAKHLMGLDADDAEGDENQPYQDAVDELEYSPAFNKSKKHFNVKSTVDKAMETMKERGNAIIHPKQATKDKATKTAYSKIAKRIPLNSKQADLDFLQAHDDLAQAREYTDEAGTGDWTQGDTCKFEERLRIMEREREETRVSWITARHVQRVRVVDPRTPQFPNVEFFEIVDDCGYPKFQWPKWVAYKLLQQTNCFTAQYIDDFDELPSDLGTLRHHLERLAVVTKPFQTLVSDMRKVYTWEDPMRTAKWMMTYFSLWYISHIMTFVYGYTFYSVAMNYFYPTSVDRIREGVRKSAERSQTASKSVDKSGNDDWLNSLMDELGPTIQLQIIDLASFLEVMYNFYHYKSPRDTVASLGLFASLSILCAFADSKFTMKVFWGILGSIFFICWPISAMYPRYRLLVSFFKWGFWNIPNHAERAFQYLQERSAVVLQAIDENGSEDEAQSTDSFQTARSHPSDFLDRDILAFACTYHKRPGQLILSRTSLRFEPSSYANHSVFSPSPFEYLYTSLIEMMKHQNSSLLSPLDKLAMGSDQLELVLRSDRPGNEVLRMDREEEVDVIMLENVRDRDKAFNSLIGFSGLRWQHLQRRKSGKNVD